MTRSSLGLLAGLTMGCSTFIAVSFVLNGDSATSRSYLRKVSVVLQLMFCLRVNVYLRKVSGEGGAGYFPRVLMGILLYRSFVW